ncbi:glycerophosphodiester phosphodiesterase family protein [Mumia sp. DW29H23]|uniref:glycerophosphodiester phosphodiesterase family protein n=1 Tax=Mumia sp. DW29H23 TaxID=3421241 RepID=UPI003D68DCFE
MPRNTPSRKTLGVVAAALTVGALAAGSTAYAAGQERGHDSRPALQAMLLDHGKSAPLMVAAHRGQWRDAPENSLEAIELAIRDGAEVVEIDVRPTKDGHLVLMHDDTVDRTTNGKGRLADLTLEQVKSLRLREGLGGAQAAVTSRTVPTLEEAMRALDGRALANLDKGWPVREQMYDALEATGTVELGLFKGSPTVGEAASFMAEHPDAHYVHIVDDATAGSIGTFPGRQPVAYEVVFDSLDDPQVQPEALAAIARTSRIWINTMWDGLAATYTDEASLRDEDLGWEPVVDDLRASMVQTDNVKALDYWRDGGDLDRYGVQPGNRTVRVQAEDYAPGGEGVGYHDLDPNRCTVMRPDEGVDICLQRGAVGVNWIRGGEWLKYEVTVKKSGTYLVSGRVSSPYSPAGTVVLDWGAAQSTPIAVRNTTNHGVFALQPWELRPLEKGTHEVVVRMPEGPYQNWNLDYLQLDLVQG